MSDDDSSDLSSISSLSPAPSNPDLDDLSDLEVPAKKQDGILKFFPKLSAKPPKEPSPPPRKRSPSPPHEFVLADDPNIAFIVMFRNRFSDVLPKSLAHFGPQELERDVVESIPGDRVEHFLCAILGLLLNRKQDVKPGHYGRALEDAISTHKNQWPKAWKDNSPLSGGATFNSMNPTQRLVLLRSLILWAMSSSDSLKAVITQSYKQNRHEDDLNQPRAVQPWGSDADKRRYYLIEGEDDTHFRVYRESSGASRVWFSVAGSIEELQVLSEKLETKDGGPKARSLSQKIAAAIPRFEAGEEKRKRREYRQIRKEQFKRPEPGASLYEGRTRGKRMKYTYSDDEDIFYTDSSTRRSTRNTGTATPAEPISVTTLSGRQSRVPTRPNFSSRQADSGLDKATPQDTNGRSARAARSGRNTSAESEPELSEGDYGDDEIDDDGDGDGDDANDGDAQVSEESEEEDEFEVDEDEAMVDDDLEDTGHGSLVVKLKVTPPRLRNTLGPKDDASMNSMAAHPTADNQELKIHVATQSSAPSLDEEDTSTAHAGDEQKSETRSTPEPPPPHVANGSQVSKGSPIPATSLAFRGSPEKPQPAIPVQIIDVGKHD